MQKFIGIVLFILITVSQSKGVDVVAQYNVWHRTPAGCPANDPNNAWFHWAWWSQSDNPCNFLGGTSWLRDTSAGAYPMIGPYRSNSEEVFRWHIRLAKAAGVSAFMASTHPGAGADGDEFIANFLVLLKVASEEGFKVGIETWIPESTGVAGFYAGVKSHIDQAVASPYNGALYRINGLPAVWFRFWTWWDSMVNLKNNLLNTRQVFWVIEGPMNFDEMATVTPTNGAQITQVAHFNYPSTSGCQYYSGYSNYVSDYLGQLIAHGYKPISHGYPSFEEQSIANEPGRTPPRSCNGGGGQLLGELFQQSTNGGAEAVFIESWNDFTEMTMIEPGVDIQQWRNLGQQQIYFGDAYKPIKQVAGFKGITFQAPPVPCSIVDPAIVATEFVECTGPIPPAISANITFTKTVKANGDCIFNFTGTISDTSGGWTAQFYSLGQKLGGPDSSAPYERSVTCKKNNVLQVWVTFTKDGMTPVSSPIIGASCIAQRPQKGWKS